MKKILSVSAVFAILALCISSCSKNGANGATGPAGSTGPTGPLSTGMLTGFVTTYDQYGFKLETDLAGVTVHISDSTQDSTVTSATGAYTFNNLKTGIYNLSYSAPGFATILTNDYSFLGGGTVIRNQALSLYPSFSLYNATIIDTTIATDPGILIRGIDTANQVARTFIVFGNSASTVSSAPANYIYVNTNTIKASVGTWSLFITSQELIDAGMPVGSTAYFVVYPISTGAPTYNDPATGKTVYTALGNVSPVLSISIP